MTCRKSLKAELPAESVANGALKILMDSVSNGTKAMRPDYRELSEAEKGAIDNIKRLGAELFDVYEAAVVELSQEQPPAMAREIALAKTKLEESIMWAVKGITK